MTRMDFIAHYVIAHVTSDTAASNVMLTVDIVEAVFDRAAHLANLMEDVGYAPWDAVS